MTGRLSLLRKFVRSDAAVAASEFAMISPILLTLTVVAFDFGRYVLATQRVEAVANSIAEMLSQTDPGAGAVESGDGTVNDTTLHWFYDSAMFTFPDALNTANQQGVAWWNLLVVNMASVKFVATPTGCTTTCAYVPTVVWSTGWRSCGSTITSANDVANPTPTTLPADIFGPNSQIVVDVSYTFYPTFGASLLPTIPIERSAYMSPRNVPIVETSGSSWAPNCPGVL